MPAYILKRIFFMLPVLLGITIISFAVINLAPGKPTDLEAEMNPRMTPEMVERLNKHYGLDKPMHIRYWIWLKNISVLDFGRSFAPDGRKVSEKIIERLPVTISINLVSMLLILAAAIPLGIFMSTHRGTRTEGLLTFLSFLFYSIPYFWLAILCILVFGIYLQWLPVSGLRSLSYAAMTLPGKVWDIVSHLLLPVLVGSLGGIASFARYVQSNFDEVMKQEYILLARIKGLPESVVLWRHALRNALIPVITILGLSVPGLIGGSVIFESIFGIPGMGQLFYQSVMARDYPVIMGLLVITSALTLAGNLLADIGYAIVDPRIRLE